MTVLDEQVEFGPKRVSINSISYPLWRMVNEAGQEATIRGTLKGYYIVHLREPVDRLSKQKESITNKILEYVRTTSMAELFPLEVLVRQNGRSCVAIEKRASQPSKIDSFDSIEGSGDPRERSCALLQTAIIEKSRKMSHLTLPKILILLGRYPLVDFDIYSEFVPEITGLDAFCAVFVVGFEEKGYMIHSSNEWLKY